VNDSYGDEPEHILDSLRHLDQRSMHQLTPSVLERHRYDHKANQQTLSYEPDIYDRYRRARSILEDPTQQAQHPAALSQIFAINWGRSNEKVAEPHLRWLIEVVSGGQPSVESTEYSATTLSDAYHHLRSYFPLTDGEGRIDWWLSREPPTDGGLWNSSTFEHSPRMQSVRRVAPEIELVDWLQARWAENPFEHDWIWALHRADSSYWAENRRIVEHAWQRWRVGDGIEWLEVVMRRIHPGDPLKNKVIQAAQGTLDLFRLENKPENLNNALLAIRTHLIRLLVATPSSPERDAEINSLIDHAPNEEDVLRWYTYQGEWNTARRFLRPKTPPKWHVLLATDFATFETAFRRVSEPDAGLLTLLPAMKLARLAEVHIGLRKQLLRTAVTRAFLLDDEDALQRYIARMARETGDRELLRAHDKGEFLDYILRSPRMSPILIGRHRMGPWTRRDLEPGKIDGHNPNDNNWWCSFDREETERALLKDYRISPAYGWSRNPHPSNVLRPQPANWRGLHPTLRSARWSRWSRHSWTLSIDDDEELRLFVRAQAEQFRKHPAFTLADNNELRALEKIPSGPRYLTERVIGEESGNRFRFWRSSAMRARSAERLHLAVRSTRYGCRRDGPHGAYSQEAWGILHRDYPESTWAKATPYWFDQP